MGLLIHYTAGYGYREREREREREKFFYSPGFHMGKTLGFPTPLPPKKCDIIITSTAIVEYKVHAA